jgi:hypothetical protein
LGEAEEVLESKIEKINHSLETIALQHKGDKL